MLCLFLNGIVNVDISLKYTDWMHFKSLFFIFLVILPCFFFLGRFNGIIGRELDDGAGVIIVIVLVAVATAVEGG